MKLKYCLLQKLLISVHTYNIKLFEKELKDIDNKINKQLIEI